MQIIELRRQLIKCEDYSIDGVAAALDQHKHGWLCVEDFFAFLKNYGVDVNMRQIQKLVEIVNWSMDGRVVEEQIKWVFEGFENGGKGYLTKVKDSNKK